MMNEGKKGAKAWKRKVHRHTGTKAQSGNLGSVARGQEAEVTNSLRPFVCSLESFILIFDFL